MTKELYESTPDAYMELLKSPTKKYYIKLELLSHWEESIGEIAKEISKDNSGQITVNKVQGVRRSCSISLINVESKYLPSPNNGFWYNRKFKLYSGIYDPLNDTVYWFSQGVFITQKATAIHNQVTINGVDKFGLFDGTLNTQMLQSTYTVHAGANVSNFIRDTISTDMGNGRPADPIPPIIDLDMKEKEILSDIVLNAGQYLGEFLIQVADSFGCDVYYDRLGRLRLSRAFNDTVSWSYNIKGSVWDFNDYRVNYIEPTVDYEYDGVNTVTVCTDNTTGKIYTYTAINDNPQSPINATDIGTRCDRNSVISYISVGSSLSDDTCRQYAEFLLLQHTCMTINVNFQSPILPHIDVDDVASVDDVKYNWTQKRFVIQSLTIPLGSGVETITAVNCDWLPHGYIFSEGS